MKKDEVEVEITPEMIEAGVQKFTDLDLCGSASIDRAVEEIYLAMRRRAECGCVDRTNISGTIEIVRRNRV